MAKKRRKQRRAKGTGYIRKTPGGKHKAHYPRAGGGYHVRTFAEEADAKAWLDGLAMAASQHFDVAGGRQSFEAWCAAWLALRAAETPPLKAKTLHDYTFKLGYPLALVGDMALADILPDHVDAAMRAISRTLAATTAQQIRNLLVQVFDEAQRRRYITHNPASLGKPRRRRAAEKRPPRRLTLAQAARLLLIVASHPTALAWWLLLTLGLREGEILGMRAGDVDLDLGTLTISQQITALAGKRHQDTPKSRASIRTLPIPRALLPAFRTLAAELPADAYLFPGRGGQPMHPTSFLHLLRHRRHSDQPATGFFVAAGLPDDVTIHHLRHTAGQLLTDAGTPENIVAAILGHTPSTITRHYAPPTVEALRPYVEQVQQQLAAEVERLQPSA